MKSKDKKNVADIAKAVGVSPGTVSNALNNRKGVSERKRREIIAAAKQMGYERSIARKEEKTIKFIQVKRHGEVVSDTYFFTEVMHGIEKECRSLGYDLIMANINLNEIGQEEAKAYFQKEESKGIILLATELRNIDLAILDQTRVPIVILDSCYRDTIYDCVLMANEDAVFKAVKYLVENGHRRIGLLHSSSYINNFYYRKKGFFCAMGDYNLKIKSGDIYNISPTLEGSYMDMKKELLRAESLPTAFFAENDIIAFGAMRAIKEVGYKIPQDVSIIGFDDMLFCETSSPRLTTICVDKNGMGVLAAKRLVDIIEGTCEVSPMKAQIRNKLIIRDSVRSIKPESEINPDEIIFSI